MQSAREILTKTQNVALRWISGAFKTTPIQWMEFVTGTLPVLQKANYALCNSLQRISRLPKHHAMNHLASSQVTRPSPSGLCHKRPLSDNIWIAKKALVDQPPLLLNNPVTRIGSRLLDCTSQVVITIPSAPPRSSKVFEQWSKAWIQTAYNDCIGRMVIGTDGSYKTKGQSISAFIIQSEEQVLLTHSRPVSAHSSYDAEMKTANMAIEFITQQAHGKVIVFIDNQSTLKSLFNVAPHSLFELSQLNSIAMGGWITVSPQNEVEFCWMPSHLGFHVNELADKAVDATPIGPFPAPYMTIASCIRNNKASVIHEWCTLWQPFTACKALHLKKNKKVILPNAWDGKDKYFMRLTGHPVLYSRFICTVSGHAPTGEFHSHFFPNEPHGCTCFAQYQTHDHLLTECPKYISKFSSMVSFHTLEKTLIESLPS